MHFRTYALMLMVGILHLHMGAQSVQLTELVEIHDRMAKAQEDDARLAAHGQLKEAMIRVWSAVDFWQTDLSPLEGKLGIAAVGEGSNRMAIISWNVELSNRTNEYGGIILFQNRQGEQVLEQLNYRPSTSLRETLNPKSRYSTDSWPGAIYYKAILQMQGNRPVYTLLGWDGADDVRTRKIVETLSISGNRVKFGVPIIDLGRGSVKRYILEYADAVSVSLQWREDMGMIVMDHLSAPDANSQGNTAFYGPDLTYDGMEWKNNHWVLRENIEVRDMEIQAPWNNPKRSRQRGRN